MQNELRKRDAVIASLKGDIEGLRREIQERDDTIQDKEKRIYDLKKKNQELEKFKFVLDYKIKELRRQMEPKENEIKAMKEQISKVQWCLTVVGTWDPIGQHVVQYIHTYIQAQK